MADPKTRRDVELQLIEKAWKDDAFRQALVTDPQGAVERELGATLPAGELTDQQLAAVAGGAWTDNCHTGLSCSGTCNTDVCRTDGCHC
jgi:hypothetical protein